MKTNSYFILNSKILTNLDTAYRNANNEEFKKLWLKKWNSYAKENCNLKPRDYDLEKEFENQVLNNQTYLV